MQSVHRCTMIKLHPKEKYCMFSTFYAYIYILDLSKAAKLLLISIFVDSKGHCTLSPKFSSKFFARKKINTTSRCVNHVYTLPPKLSSVIKKIRIRFDFLHFRIRNKHFDMKGWRIRKKWKTHTKSSDSVCKDLNCPDLQHNLFVQIAILQ